MTESVSRIVYSFRDGPLPPDEQRNYTITLSPRTVRLVVDSYGVILLDRTFRLGRREFQETVSLLLRSIRTMDRSGEMADSGCTGGTSEHLSVHGTGGEMLSGSVWHCGGQSTGDIEGDLGVIARVIRGLVPDFDRLLSSTLEDGG